MFTGVDGGAAFDLSARVAGAALRTAGGWTCPSPLEGGGRVAAARPRAPAQTRIKRTSDRVTPESYAAPVAEEEASRCLVTCALVTHLVLYDGVCGLCDHFIQFLLRIDRHDRLRFAALQSATGMEILRQHGRSADALSTVIVVPDHDPTVTAQPMLDRSDAALLAISAAGGVYGLVRAARVIPRFARDVSIELA